MAQQTGFDCLTVTLLGMLPVNRLTDYPVMEAWPVLKLLVRLTAQ